MNNANPAGLRARQTDREATRAPCPYLPHGSAGHSISAIIVRVIVQATELDGDVDVHVAIPFTRLNTPEANMRPQQRNIPDPYMTERRNCGYPRLT
jgi:hypothetical protein